MDAIRSSKGPRKMPKLAKNTENPSIWAMPVDVFVVRDSQRGKGEGCVILRDMCTKLLSLGIGTNQKSVQWLRWLGEGSKLHLAVTTAGPKSWERIGGLRNFLTKPVKSIAVFAGNRHLSAAMALCWIPIFMPCSHEGFVAARSSTGLAASSTA